MKTLRTPAAALALSLAAAPAFSSGADGPSFPSLQSAPVVATPAPGQVMGAAGPMTSRRAGARPIPVAADTLADEPVIKDGRSRSRAENRAEVLKANRAGEIGHATTPY